MSYESSASGVFGVEGILLVDRSEPLVEVALRRAIVAAFIVQPLP